MNKFTYFFPALLPEIFVVIASLLVLILVTILSKRFFYNDRVFTLSLNKFSLVFIFILSCIYFLLIATNEPLFTLTLGITSTELVFYLRLLLTAIFIFYLIYMWALEVKTYTFYTYEFYFILFICFVSLHLLILSSTFLNAFIFIEIYSLCVYYLIASRQTPRALESAIKYFIFGSLSSAFLFFGLFLLYYTTGTSGYLGLDIFSVNNSALQENPLYLIACFLITMSLLFKIGGGFFFFWIVEVYDGISYPMFIFLNVFSKPIYLFVLFNFLFSTNLAHLVLLTKILLFFSLLFGAFGMLYQIKIKRLLIYSSIYNLSFMGLAFWDLTFHMSSVLLFFLALYLFNSFILMVLYFSIRDWSTHTVLKNLSDLPSVKFHNPYLAYVLLFFNFVASGIPPFSVFLAKLTLFVEGGRTLPIFWVILLIFSTIFTFFFYIRIARLLLHPVKYPTFFLKPLPFSIVLLISFSIFLNLVLFPFYGLLVLFIL